MLTIEFIEDNSGELAQQALDEGYQAVTFAVGDSLEKAMKENAELKGRLELWRKSEEGTLAQMAETNERFEGALSTIRELEAQLADLPFLKQELDRLQASIGPQTCDIHASFSPGCLNCRLAQREAQLAEANDAKEIAESAAYQYSTKIAGHELTAKAAEVRAEKAERELGDFKRWLDEESAFLSKDDLVATLVDVAKQAEARAEAMRKALEMYANEDDWLVYREEGMADEYIWLGVQAGKEIGWTVAQAALADERKGEN
jgi:hypothetical protein